jgi:hypothetical protein
VDRGELLRWYDGVWIAEAPLRFYGLPFGTRMTIVRLPDGGLWLHSPIEITPGLGAEIRSLGSVRHIVSPNKLHHLHLASAKQAFPAAKLHAPPGLRSKRTDLVFDGELGSEAHPDWRGVLDQLVIEGSRMMQEVVFLHRASRTLVVADLCEHFGPWSPWLVRVLARIAFMYGRPCLPPDWRLTFRDRIATRRSFSRLLAWDFERVILAHGALLEADARRIFEREYAWALP